MIKICLPKHHRRVPLVLQFEMVECGAASLSMILKYYGLYIGLPELRVACGISRDGSNMLSIKQAAINYNLDVRAYKAESQQLISIIRESPGIIWWNHNHFLVLEKIANERFYLVDPASGRYSVNKDDFQDAYSGLVLTFFPSTSFKKHGREEKSLQSFLPHLLSYKYSILFLFCIALAMLVPSLASPGLSGAFVDSFLQNKKYNLGIPIVWLSIFMSLLSALLSLVELKTVRRISLQMQRKLSLQIALKLLKVKYSYYTTRYLGDIAGRLGLAASVSSTLVHQILPAILSLVGAFLILPFIVLISWQLSFVSLIYVVLSSLLTFWAVTVVLDSQRSIELESGKLSGMTVRIFSDSKTIRSSGLERSYLEKWQELYAPILFKQQMIHRTSNLFQWLSTLINTFYSYGTIAFSGYLVMKGDINLAGFMAFQVLRGQVTGPLLSASGLINTFQTASAELCRLDDLRSASDDTKTTSLDRIYQRIGFESNKETNMDLPATDANRENKLLDSSLRLTNVSLRFSPIKPPVITDVSLSVAPGRMLTLVGPSGSGKSTLLKAITGLYDITDGSILYGGKPWKWFESQYIRSKIGYVSQDVTSFRGTIRDNITLFNPSWPEESIKDACRLAGLNDILATLPMGLDTLLGDSGSGLSGGQLQRLEIARALLKSPQIICLDEATSSLDIPSEMELIENIKAEGITIVCVAHRLISALKSDYVAVLFDGQLAEIDSPQSLSSNRNSYFYKLLQAESRDEPSF